MRVVSFVVNGYKKENCDEYHTWRAKEVTILVLVYSRVNLALVSNDILVGKF